MLDAKDIQEAVNRPPDALPVKNANYHVHVGAAPQRPYARLEDHMGQLSGWPSFADIPAEAGVKRAEDGSYYREVRVHLGRTVEKDGRLYQQVGIQRRGVALTLQMAQAATQNGTPTDYYDGTSWIRGGRKREMEYAANLGSDFTEDVILEEAAPEDQAAHAQRKAAVAALAQPVAQAPADDASEAKTSAKSAKKGD